MKNRHVKKRHVKKRHANGSMKKIASVILTGTLILFIAGCAGTQTGTSGSGTETGSTSEASSDTEGSTAQMSVAEATTKSGSASGTESASKTESASGETGTSPAESEAEESKPVIVETTGVYTSSEDVLKSMMQELGGSPRVFLYDASETFEEYYVFYTTDGQVSRLLDICFFFRDDYSEDQIANIDMNNLFNAFDQMEFATAYFNAADDFYILSADFDHLDEPANAAVMIDNVLREQMNVTPGDKISAEEFARCLGEKAILELDPETMQPL